MDGATRLAPNVIYINSVENGLLVTADDNLAVEQEFYIEGCFDTLDGRLMGMAENGMIYKYIPLSSYSSLTMADTSDNGLNIAYVLGGEPVSPNALIVLNAFSVLAGIQSPSGTVFAPEYANGDLSIQSCNFESKGVVIYVGVEGGGCEDGLYHADESVGATGKLIGDDVEEVFGEINASVVVEANNKTVGDIVMNGGGKGMLDDSVGLNDGCAVVDAELMIEKSEEKGGGGVLSSKRPAWSRVRSFQTQRQHVGLSLMSCAFLLNMHETSLMNLEMGAALPTRDALGRMHLLGFALDHAVEDVVIAHISTLERLVYGHIASLTVSARRELSEDLAFYLSGKRLFDEAVRRESVLIALLNGSVR